MKTQPQPKARRGTRTSARPSLGGKRGDVAKSRSTSRSSGAAPAAATAGAPTIFSPRDLLLKYQRAWADDDARFKIGNMARQVGKDFSAGEEGVRDCLLRERRKEKTDWLIAAPSERQSLESLEKWKQWAEAYHLALADYQEDRDTSEALLKSATITFPGGSRVIAVPGKPDTVRGFSANVVLTEFAFFEQPDKTWRAILPSITNPLRGGEKKARIISTPNGKGNKFAELWAENHNVKNARWSTHRVTIHDAKRLGLPIDVEELRAALNDPEGWAQEFELEFLDAAAVLLTYELIATCESPEAMEIQPPDYWLARRQFPVDLGIDFGRKKNLTVCWAAEAVADLQITREVLCLQNLSTPKQVEILTPRIQAARRVCLDYTGPGVGLGDYLVEKFGEWKPEAHQYGKVELVTMTNPAKIELFSKLRMAFENRRHRIPATRAIREDLHSMNRIVTRAGNVSYRAPHTDDGHADRCTALALVTRAASFDGLGFTAEVI